MSEVTDDTSTIIIIVILYASMSIVLDRVGAIATITLAEWSAGEFITATAALSCTSSFTATLGQFKHSSRSRWYQTPHRNICRLHSPDSSHFDRWEEVQDNC